MKNIKISSFIFILIAIFLSINIIGYKLLYNSIRSSHEKDTEILFHKIKGQTSDLLAKQMHQYIIQKPILLQKHKIVQAYINTHDLNVSLNEIYKKINSDDAEKPYNIYITDKNLTIQNTTYKPDLGFNLSFALMNFEKNKASGIIGCSFPIREISTNNFFSYTDTYLSKNGDDRAAILQVSYTYRDLSKELMAIEKLISQNPIIQDVKAYNFGKDNFIYDMVLLDDSSYQHTNDELVSIQKKARKLSRELNSTDLFVKHFRKDGIHYQQLYMSSQSPISEEVRIVYSLLLNDDLYYTRIDHLNLFMFFSMLMGIVGIFFIAKVRDKEIILSEQDKFVQSAMHEIKTPLSIITLNNELRQLEYGTDDYSKEIDNALKILHTSYNSMGFIMNKTRLDYAVQTIKLEETVKERIDFFQSIAVSNNRKIIAAIHSDCSVEMSVQELTRLIDNNLSNAVKYSDAGSDIEVVLEANKLSFHTQGRTIQDKEKIFHRYVRENTTVGGYGLGLSIIKDITQKYDIDIQLESDPEHGTTFTYIFKTGKCT